MYSNSTCIKTNLKTSPMLLHSSFSFNVSHALMQDLTKLLHASSSNMYCPQKDMHHSYQ